MLVNSGSCFLPVYLEVRSRRQWWYGAEFAVGPGCDKVNIQTESLHEVLALCPEPL